MTCGSAASKEGRPIRAVVAGGFYNPFFNDLLEALTRHLRDAGKQVMLVHAESDLALDGAVGEMARYRVDAVVTPLSVRSREVADTPSAFRIPMVTLNAGLTGGLIRAVVSDSPNASARAAQFFTTVEESRSLMLAGRQARSRT